MYWSAKGHQAYQAAEDGKWYGNVRTVPGNMHVKSEVRSFNRFKLVWLTGPLHKDAHTDTHRTKTVSPPFTPFTWRRQKIMLGVGYTHLALQTIRTSDYSYPGQFVLWVDYSYLGLFVRWTFRTTDYSYYGLFVPYVKYSHINGWCEKALTLQAVCQMQVDLGARLVICMCSCGIWLFCSYNS